MRAFLLALSFFGPFVATGVAHAQAAAGERAIVYVEDVGVSDPKLKAQAASLTSSLCGALAKDKRLDVMCAPDVKQILGFAAASLMVGTANPATENLQKRMGLVNSVVQAVLSVRGTDLVLTVIVGPKAPESEAAAMFTSAPVLRLEEVSPQDKPRLLDKLPDVAARLTKAMLAPPAPASSTPPEPLSTSTSAPSKK